MLRAFADGTLFGERFGVATPWILALHGWGRTHADFAAVLGDASTPTGAEGSGALDAIALDLPGFGSAPAPPEAWGTGEYAAAIAPILREMAERVVVVGHSFGGIVATQLARNAPERVGALVLTGAPLFRPTERSGRVPWRYRAARAARRAHVLSEERLERARERYGSADYQAASGVMRAVLVRRLTEDYGSLVAAIAATDVPVELVWGSADTTSPLAVARRAKAAIPHTHLVTLDGIGHLTPTEAPAALRAAILACRP